MPNLKTALEGLSPAGGAYEIEAPEGWTQGRTLYGGMTAALAAQTAALATPDLPPLRSALFSFLGPASGRLRFTSEVLRQGRSSTIIGVDCVAEGGLAARGVLTYGGARESQVRHGVRRDMTLPAPADCEPFSLGPRGPGFFQNFEMKLAAGARPFTAGAAPAFEVWVRHLDEEGVDPIIALLALADSLPPAAMVAFAAPAPISTMTWMVDILHPAPAGTWRLLRSASEAAADGYSQQAMELFTEDGERIAVGRQTVAIFA